MDWVVQPEVYGLGQYELAAPVVGGIGFEFFEVPITAHEDWASEGDIVVAGETSWAPRRFPQLEQTVIRIKGNILAWLDPVSRWWETENGYGTLRLRIRKTSQGVGNVDPVDPQLASPNTVQTIYGATMANEEFLWEDHYIWVASTSWGSIDTPPQAGPVKFPVDVTTKRRLRVGEQVVLQMTYVTQEAFGFGPGSWPDIAIVTQLRALVKTIT